MKKLILTQSAFVQLVFGDEAPLNHKFQKEFCPKHNLRNFYYSVNYVEFLDKNYPNLSLQKRIKELNQKYDCLREVARIYISEKLSSADRATSLLAKIADSVRKEADSKYVVFIGLPNDNLPEVVISYAKLIIGPDNPIFIPPAYFASYPLGRLTI